MEEYNMIALVTVLNGILLMVLAFRVGDQRRKNSAAAIETSDSQDVLIANRIHMNTVEMSVAVIPALWVAAIYSNLLIAEIVGAIWLISRVWYVWAYPRKKRTVPFVISMLSFVVLSVSALIGILL